MKTLLKTHSINAKRVPAVNGWLLEPTALKAISGHYSLRIGRGPCGATLSHLSAILHAKESKYNCVWVMEDDVEFLTPPRKLIPQLISELDEIDPEWDILFTDTNSRKHDKKGNHIGYYKSVEILPRPDRPHRTKEYHNQRIKKSKYLTQIFIRFGAYSMIISKRGIDKIFNYFRDSCLFSPYDIDIHYIDGLKEYSTNRDYITNTNLFSTDVQEDRSGIYNKKP